MNIITTPEYEAFTAQVKAVKDILKRNLSVDAAEHYEKCVKSGICEKGVEHPSIDSFIRKAVAQGVVSTSDKQAFVSIFPSVDKSKLRAEIEKILYMEALEYTAEIDAILMQDFSRIPYVLHIAKLKKFEQQFLSQYANRPGSMALAKFNKLLVVTKGQFLATDKESPEVMKFYMPHINEDMFDFLYEIHKAFYNLNRFRSPMRSVGRDLRNHVYLAKKSPSLICFKAFGTFEFYIQAVRIKPRKAVWILTCKPLTNSGLMPYGVVLANCFKDHTTKTRQAAAHIGNALGARLPKVKEEEMS